MSANPVRNVISFSSGDITSGRNMLGLTTRVVDASAGPILQTPGTFYSDYFTNYLVSVTGSGFFDLAQIGTGVSVGYTMCINCTTGAGQLTVRAFDTSVVAVMVAGDKIFLTASASTSTWRVSYAVPSGSNNLLLVYNGTNPRADTLPIQKEISIDGSFQYGVKCLTSFDFNEPAFWTNVAQTNENRIVSLANTGSIINTIGLVAAACHLTAASSACTTNLSNLSYTSTLASVSCTTNPSAQGKSLFGASSNSAIVITGDGGSSILGSNICTSNNTSGNTFIAASANSNAGNTTGKSVIIGSESSDVTTNGNGSNVIIGSTGSTSVGPTSITSIISSQNCSTTSTLGAVASVIASRNCDLVLEDASIITAISSNSLTVNGIYGSDGLSFISTNNQFTLSQTGVVVNPFPYCSSISCNQSIMVSQPTTTSNTSYSSTLCCSACNIVNVGNNPSAYNAIIGCSSSSVIGSINSTQLSGNATAVQDSSYCNISSSDNSQCTTSARYTNLGATFGTVYEGTIISSSLSSDTVTVTGNGSTSFNAITGYANTRAGVTILSSHSINPVSAGDLRYCVIGGFNTPTWSIDSKTGNYYGQGVFNAGTPLPGIAEMYENLVVGVIPYGRLLQLEDGKVRLATNGESGFVISRPHSTAAFIGGNPMFDWPKKYITDEFGLPVYQDYTKDEYVAILKSQGKTDGEIESMELGDIVRDKKLNPAFDPKQLYVPRSDRADEWTTCEKSGIVVVEYVGQLSVGDYVVSASNGFAKQATRKTNIKVLAIDGLFAKVDIENASYGEYVSLAGSIPNTGVTSNATGLPADVVIKSLSFTDNNVVLARDTKLKLVIEVTGDMMTATDLLVNLSNGVNIYWFGTSYARTSGGYRINSVIKSVIPAGSYKINFVTTKTQPSNFTGSLKLY